MSSETLRFDGSALSDLAHDLRAAAERFRVYTDETLAKIGVELVEAARVIAGQHSQTVAGTIRMRTVPGMVIVTVGNEETPIAALWELGNKGTRDSNQVQGVYFRHPVFGGDAWVSQRRFPMLRPAQQALRKEIKRRMDATYDQVLEPYRLKPTERL